MSGTYPSRLLRTGLLEGTSVLVAGAWAPPDDDGSLASAVHRAAGELGASVGACRLTGGAGGNAGEAADEGQALEEHVESAVGELGGLGLLAIDAAGIFAAVQAAGGLDEREPDRVAMLACMQHSWDVTRAVANCAFIARGAPGRIVYLAPRPQAGTHAEAARAGLENLARTLSIEWARYAVTPVTLAPGASTEAEEVAALVAYLASPAGAYFSGCLLDLRGPTLVR